MITTRLPDPDPLLSLSIAFAIYYYYNALHDVSLPDGSGLFGSCTGTGSVYISTCTNLAGRTNTWHMSYVQAATILLANGAYGERH